VITPNSEQCVEFYYYQHPGTLGSLNLYVKFTSTALASIGLPIWSEPFVSNGISGWQIAQVSLGHTIVISPFQVVFEEYVESTNPGIIYSKHNVFSFITFTSNLSKILVY
jgi:hypothetical protein